ncbi:EAL domain-containing protein, partial [Palleronia sp.]|uniref:EAL domain-containing protein n=1 Tax=Palleronia sp. TaxID=1940284 RepID=UPI0035C850AC
MAFGAALFLVVGSGTIGLVQMHAVARVTHEIRQLWLPKLTALNSVERLLTAHELLGARRIQSLDFRQMAQISEQMAEVQDGVEAQFARYGNLALGPAEAHGFAALQGAWAARIRSFADLLDRINSGETLGATIPFEGETRAHLHEARAELAGLEGLAEAGTRAAEAKAGKIYRRALLLTGVVVALSAVIVVVLIYWASTRISSPLLRVSQAMRRLTEGDDTETTIEGADRSDEIGVLVAAAAGYRECVTRARDLAALAETERHRMHAAISNMPIGFCMFDANDRLVVCNDRYAQIYKLPTELTVAGTPHRRILAARIDAGTFDGDDPDAHVAETLAAVAAGTPAGAVWKLRDDRYISTIFQPIAGGWLSTHEEITERRRSEDRIRHMARHDALTDLPNRTLFQERLGQALQHLPRGRGLAVLALDLDRFKAVNDTLGHPVGDLLLKAAAERLRRKVQEGDTISRLGGDEFAVIQACGEQPAASRSLARRMIETLSEPFDIEGHQISIGTSVGIAVAPGDGTDPGQMLKNADLALYRAKSDGRGVYCFFESEMDALMQERRRLELDLRRAVSEGQFVLHYQPVIDVEASAVTCFEVLLRWLHPERGLVQPGEFIPLAEETGLIVPLGEWILKQACDDAAGWAEGISLAVNLSPVQFRSKRLIEAVTAALDSSGFPASRLELEITEGVLLTDTEDTLATLHRLRELGVRIAMDDFGTGNSSLRYLQSFPFDRLKIDASFIRRRDQNSMAIVRAVAGLARAYHGDLGIGSVPGAPEATAMCRLHGPVACGAERTKL